MSEVDLGFAGFYGIALAGLHGSDEKPQDEPNSLFEGGVRREIVTKGEAL